MASLLLEGIGTRQWCVTGAAGFIGSHLVEALLKSGQRVTALDNFSTGHRSNLENVRERVGEDAWSGLRLIEGDIRDADACSEAVSGAEFVLHQAALGSVPRSVADPLSTHTANVDGFVNMILASRDEGIGRFVYASSSSVYGDHPGLPKVESEIGTPLSPYAVSKRVDELYAATFTEHYDIQAVGLRYFNVFGPRQDPAGAYAAVIPRWIGELLSGKTPMVHGDGETSRDFCYVANVVQANLRAALAPEAEGVFNVAFGERTSLIRLFGLIKEGLVANDVSGLPERPEFGPFRVGDVRHSLADFSRAREELGYNPSHSVAEGLSETVDWYVSAHGESARLGSS